MAAVVGLLVLFAHFFLLPPGSFCEVCAPLEFDISTLSGPNFWWMATSVDNCSQKPSISSAKCVFLFAICKPVFDMCPEGSGICQTSQVNLNKTAFYSWTVGLGEYEGFKFVTGKDHFNVSYAPTIELYHSEIEFVQTTIMFKCNRENKWNSTWTDNTFGHPRGPQAPPPMEVTVKDALGIRTYTIVFNSSSGCRQGVPTKPGGGPASADASLSAGSILLILFFPGVFLYCFIGVLINSGAGKTGKELIPQSKFWFGLPHLIMDGFAFLVAKLTCSQMTSSSETYEKM